MQNAIRVAIADAEMKIYTKNGDNGSTTIATGKKIKKSSQILWVIGTLDELNASLGFLHNYKEKKLVTLVINLQKDLMGLGSLIAGAKVSLDFEEKTTELENIIDSYESKLPKLSNFILQGGTQEANYLHTARVICRRLERELVKLFKTEKMHLQYHKVGKYVNRLSDLLFVLARYVNFKSGHKEIIWKNDE